MAKKNQHTKNTEIEAFIKDKDSKNETYSKQDKDYIAQYTGAGGQGKKGAKGQGVLYEFFTPDYICKHMWELAYYHGFEKTGKVLEQSVGNGQLIKDAPDYTKVTGFEINPVSARICEILYPGVTVYNNYFETAFMHPPMFRSRMKGKEWTWLDYPYSLIMGNPPYGKYKNLYSSFFKKPKIEQIEHFFMYYGMQLLEKNGLLIFLTGSNFLRNGRSYNNFKVQMEPVCEIVDAYRLPSVFQYSDVPTDILVFKKK